MTRRSKDEAGVSTVLGAILMFGLLVVTLVMIQTQFVPVWDKQREEDTMLEVAKQVNTLKSDLDRLAGNQSATPITNQVSLAKPQGFTFFQAPNIQLGTLAFAPASGTGMTVSSNQLTIQSRGGQDLFGISELWETVGGGVVIPSIDGIAHLRLRIVDPSGPEGNMTLAMVDANGMCAGKIVLTVTVQSGSDNNVEARIYRANVPLAATCDDSVDPQRPNPITITNSDQKKQLIPPYYYLDAFDPELQFDSVLAAATYPVSVSLSLGGLQGDYTIVYDTTSGGGSTRVGGGGLVIPNYTSTFPAGTLSIDQPNNRAPHQTYTMEYGAVFLTQPAQGTAMVVPPSFAVSTTSTQTTVQWSFAALIGGANQVKAPGGGTVLATPSGQRTNYDASAPSLTLSITTQFPTLWTAYWDESLQLAGLSSGGNEYTLASNATSATLTLYGPVTDPLSIADDLFFRFNEASVAVELRPAG